MDAQELKSFLESAGKDPSRLIFEDELTGIYNRRFLLRYLEMKIPWDQLNGHSVSLLMMDLDHFKSINDTYGHLVGDQALVWLADHLKAAAGNEGYPIRYAGDEFILLLESGDKPLAVSVGQKLLDRIHATSFAVPDADKKLDLTLSLGVATAPHDAKDGKSFVQKADMALYLAKKRGRDQLVDAAEVIGDSVSEKAAIYQLGDIKIVGRNDQLKTIRAALKDFRQRNRSFILVKGAAGMGKSAFLDAVRKSLGRSSVLMASARGAPQEMYRPYYVVEQILVNLLNGLPDKGLAALDELSPTERGFLSRIMPRLAGEEAPSEEADETARRKGIFEALAKLLSRVAQDRPLFLFLDDMFFCDEATLLLIRRLSLRSGLKLFVIATTSEGGDQEEPSPLDRFLRDHGTEVGLVPLVMTPLTSWDITQHIRSLFPGIDLPEGFCDKLSQISQGNPLFLAEILRKLVLDRQITLVGQQWTLHPIQEGYLPRSMEEIVTEKIAALDGKSRELLQQVSALGENVPLSVLVGSSSEMEARVLEFIDQAVAQGLLASDFALNDENIRFLGKRVLEITYNAIDPKQKKELHKQIGTYQEGLFEQLQAPAATLAYHFKRSNDVKKAERYERIQNESNLRNFNAQEALEYSGEAPSEEPPEEIPLSAEGLAQVPQLVRNFTVALRNIKLYPPGSKSVIRVNRDLKETIDRILQDNECLSISQARKSLVINGQRMDTSDFKMVAESLVQILERFELKGLAFHQGLTDQELEALTEEMGRSEKKVFEDTHWETFSKTHALKHIDLKQMRYAMRPSGGGAPAAAAGAAGKASGRMEAAAVGQIPDIVRAFLSAARTIKLYPITSNASKAAVGTLSAALRRFLETYSLLSLSHVGSSLLVNGEKIDTSEFKALAEAVVKYFNFLGLKSLTFLDSHTDEELKALIDEMGKVPATGAEGKFWKAFAKEKGLAGILFDQHTFEVRIKHTGATGGGAGAGEAPGAAAAEEATLEDEAPPSEMPLDALIEHLPEIVADFLLKEDLEGLKSMLTEMFDQFPKKGAAVREQMIDACRRTAEEIPAADQFDFARAVAAPLLKAFLRETESKIILDCAALMHTLTAALVQFTDYPNASRIMMALRKRRKELHAAGGAVSQTLAKSFDGLLHPATQKLLLEDFLSGDPEKQRDAARLLAGFGDAATAVLIDIVKKVDDYRARHLAATLLAKLDTSAADRVKRALALECPPEEKIRLLGVLELLKIDLRAEVLRLLDDSDPGVRQAALRLAERSKDPGMAEGLLGLAKEAKEEVAVDAISCIGRIKPSGAARELLSLLDSTKDQNRLRACCLALGEIGGPESVATLAKIVRKKGFLFFKKRYSPEVQVAAAYAIGQIRHPDAAEAMAAFAGHPDPRISQIAQGAGQGGAPAASKEG
jgi:diguanylate cyclase (GGDEF)-like protein